MNVDQLKEYLGIVFDMEKNIYLQNQSIMRLQSEADSLGIPHHFEKPQKPTEYTSDAPATIIFCLIFGIIGFLIFRWGFVRFTGSSLLAFLPGLFATIFGGSCLICMIILAITDLMKDSRNAKDSQLRQRQYALNMRNYEDNLRKDSERVKNELVRKSVLNAELNVLKSHFNTSWNNLYLIYEKDIIFNKYRNFAAVCSLYEYFCAGRCSTLGEAYNLLEYEMRMNKIITQMNIVISCLNKIKNNQYMLYSAIQDSNSRINDIVDTANSIAIKVEDMSSRQKLSGESLRREIRRLQEASLINAYQTERVRKELAYMNRINYLSGHNGGSSFNLPPS